MKFYDGSVKDRLIAYFGSNTVFSMRKSADTFFETEDDRCHMAELAWQYADRRALGVFLGEVFLSETILTDDCIVYLCQFQHTPMAYILFMVIDEDPAFQIDPHKAKQIAQAWAQAGYQPWIIRECVVVEQVSRSGRSGFQFASFSSRHRGTSIYQWVEVNGQSILSYALHPCCASMYPKLVSVASGNSQVEYECLFTENVTLSTVTAGQERTLSTGISSLMTFFAENTPVVIAYHQIRELGVYKQFVLAGRLLLDPAFNPQNLITDIRLTPVTLAPGEWLVMQNVKPFRLCSQIPTATAVRFLDPSQMHGYVIQLNYGADNLRNYYLYMFREPVPSDCFDLNGFHFTKEIFYSAAMDVGGNLCFSNGFSIPRHHLYHHSYRQVQAAQTQKTVYQGNGLKIEALYTLPLQEFKDFHLHQRYRGRPDECFGPSMAWLDDMGNRISDIAIVSTVNRNQWNNVSNVCIEPTGKYGLLNADGTWLAPPVYDSLSMGVEDACDVPCTPAASGLAHGVRSIDGKPHSFLITCSGEEIPFEHQIDVQLFTHNRCRFRDGSWNGAPPSPGLHYCDTDSGYDLIAGNWGFLDSAGHVIVPPQYVYALDFDLCQGQYALVARLLHGQVQWGEIDREGNEIIPCIFQEIFASPVGDAALAFMRNGDTQYGVMDMQGNVLVEPMFDDYYAFDARHRLVTAGPSEDELGVYSVDLQRFITPCEYDAVDYCPRWILCEPSSMEKCRYFDYTGRELDSGANVSFHEKDDMLLYCRDGKYGVMDMDLNVLLPPILSMASSSSLEFYRQGLLVTGYVRRLGLSTLSGQKILPEAYDKITLNGSYILASQQTDGSWTVQDTLLTLDGTVLLAGMYRHIRIEKDGKRLTAETPEGLTVYRLTTGSDPAATASPKL